MTRDERLEVNKTGKKFKDNMESGDGMTKKMRLWMKTIKYFNALRKWRRILKIIRMFHF